MAEAWIIDAARTPRGIGKVGKGALADIHSQQLLAQVLAALAERNGLNTADIDDVIAGCGTQTGNQGFCIARMAALDAGYDLDAPGLAVDRFCGGGLSAVNVAAMGVMSGQQQLVIAGGVESMSHAQSLRSRPLVDSDNLRLRERYPQPHQGVCADLIASLEGFSREELDALALESQRRADAAIRDGLFTRSTIAVRDADGRVVLDHEEFPRPQTTAEGLAALHPVFGRMYDAPFDETGQTMRAMVERVYPDVRIEHVHHAGNSSGVVDGAGAVVIASPDYARAHGLKPRARIRSFATAGTDPTLMLNGPAPAAAKALKLAGMSMGDVDLIEVNEAFAVVPLKFMRETGVNADIVNVNGGAMALGHPIGATGAIILGTLLDEMERRDVNVGLTTLCAAGGMAPATIIERI